MHDQADRLRQLVQQGWVRAVCPLATGGAEGGQAKGHGRGDRQDLGFVDSARCAAENTASLLPTPIPPDPLNNPNVGQDPGPECLADHHTSSQ